MDRKYIYVIAILLSITLVVADYYMNRSLESVETINFIDDTNAINALINSEEDLKENLESNIANATSLVTLTITNKQNDNANLEYTYIIKIDNMSGVSKLIKADGTSTYQVFSANGETTITLKSNETITLVDIPLNSNYTITQKEADNYKTYIDNEEKSSISGTIKQNTSFTFDNISKIAPTPSTPPISQKPNGGDDNPITADYIFIPVIVLVILSIILILNSKIKIKRFE